MDMYLLSQGMGWVGTILIVSAYFYSSFSIHPIRVSLYQSLNLLGAICVGVNVFHQQAWPAVALQVVWGIIAIISLLRKPNIKK